MEINRIFIMIAIGQFAISFATVRFCFPDAKWIEFNRSKNASNESIMAGQLLVVVTLLLLLLLLLLRKKSYRVCVCATHDLISKINITPRNHTLKKSKHSIFEFLDFWGYFGSSSLWNHRSISNLDPSFVHLKVNIFVWSLI